MTEVNFEELSDALQQVSDSPQWERSLKSIRNYVENPTKSFAPNVSKATRILAEFGRTNPEGLEKLLELVYKVKFDTVDIDAYVQAHEEEIEKAFPNVTVENLGEIDVLVEQIDVDRHKSPVQTVKIIFVSLIAFFGTAFTIMAFHNDVGLGDVLSRIYELVVGVKSDGFTSIEISYSIGLAAGIIVFYNHIGGKRLTSDPTPLEVEMRNYERDVNQALVEMAGRQKLEEDVE